MKRRWQLINACTGEVLARGPLLNLNRQLALYRMLYQRFRLVAELRVEPEPFLANARRVGAL